MKCCPGSDTDGSCPALTALVLDCTQEEQKTAENGCTCRVPRNSPVLSRKRKLRFACCEEEAAAVFLVREEERTGCCCWHSFLFLWEKRTLK